MPVSRSHARAGRYRDDRRAGVARRSSSPSSGVYRARRRSNAATARPARSVRRRELAEAKAGWRAMHRNVSSGRLLSLTRDRERMSGNICRCAAYPNIVAANKEVAEEDRKMKALRTSGSSTQSGGQAATRPGQDSSGRTNLLDLMSSRSATAHLSTQSLPLRKSKICQTAAADVERLQQTPRSPIPWASTVQRAGEALLSAPRANFGTRHRSWQSPAAYALLVLHDTASPCNSVPGVAAPLSRV